LSFLTTCCSLLLNDSASSLLLSEVHFIHTTFRNLVVVLSPGFVVITLNVLIFKICGKVWVRTRNTLNTERVYFVGLISGRSILILFSHLSQGLPKWTLPFWFSNQNFICISHLFHACYMPRLSYSP